jgi:hypothetical protein
MPTLTVKGAKRHRELNDDGLVLALIMHASG